MARPRPHHECDGRDRPQGPAAPSLLPPFIEGYAYGSHVIALAGVGNLDFVWDLGADEAADYATTGVTIFFVHFCPDCPNHLVGVI